MDWERHLDELTEREVEYILALREMEPILHERDPWFFSNSMAVHIKNAEMPELLKLIGRYGQSEEVELTPKEAAAQARARRRPNGNRR